MHINKHPRRISYSTRQTWSLCKSFESSLIKFAKEEVDVPLERVDRNVFNVLRNLRFLRHAKSARPESKHAAPNAQLLTSKRPIKIVLTSWRHMKRSRRPYIRPIQKHAAPSAQRQSKQNRTRRSQPTPNPDPHIAHPNRMQSNTLTRLPKQNAYPRYSRPPPKEPPYTNGFSLLAFFKLF